MTSSADQKHGISLRSGLLLTFFSFLCLALTGAAGYVKMRLDRAELTVFSEESTVSSETEGYRTAVLQLGYGGFLGAAQTFMGKMDKPSLATMQKTYEKAASGVAQAVETAPAAVQRDAKAVLDIYRDILVRAQTGADALSSGITQSDLIMASGAMGTLETRLRALETKAKNEEIGVFRQWSLGLLFLAWAGAFLATCLAIWAFGVQDRKNAGALKALAQSVANMTKGDIDAPLWGLERTDEIGDLARELDIARCFFAQVPDIAVATENGAHRITFSGDGRSLFKGMMQAIEERFGKAAQNVDSFTDKIAAHQDAFSALNARVEIALDAMRQKNEAGERVVSGLAQTLEDVAKSLGTTQEENARRIRDVVEKLVAAQETGVRSLSDSARSLAKAQEESVYRIDRAVPFLQERAKAMAEAAQTAGAQVARSLASLGKTEESMRVAATTSQNAIKHLAQATGQMGERMLAALNLMQATGKKFNETSDSVTSRLTDAVQTLEKGNVGLYGMIERVEDRLESTLKVEENMSALAARTEVSAVQMEKAVETIAKRHETLGEHAATAAQRMAGIMAGFDSAQRAMHEATGHIQRDTSLIGNLLQEMRKNNEHLLSSLAQSGQAGFSAVQTLAEKSHALMQRLEMQIQSQSHAAEGHLDTMAASGQALAQHAATTGGALGQAVAALRNEQEKLADTRGKFVETLTDLGVRLEEHATATFGKTESLASKSFVRLTGIAEQVENVVKKLGMLGQLTGTLGAVAGQLGQIVPALTSGTMPIAAPGPDMNEAKALIVRQTADVIKAMEKQWHDATVQIEAMHDQLAQIVVQQKDQIETRLVVLDKKLRETSETLLSGVSSASNEETERQGEVLNELVTAIARINEHVMELDEVVDKNLARTA